MLKLRKNAIKFTFIVSILLFLLSVFKLISLFHIDYLWFSQFNLGSVLIKRWLFQILGFSFALIIGSLTYFWLQRTSTYPVSQLKDSDFIDGYTYSLSLSLSFLTIFLSLLFLFKITLLSINSPSYLGNWWEHIKFLEINSLSFILLSTLVVIIIFINISHLIFQLFATTLFSIITSRAWSLWTLAFATPPSGIREPLLGSDITFSLTIYPALNFFITIYSILLLITLSNSVWHHFSRSNNISNWSATKPSLRHLNSFLFLFSLLLINLFLYCLLSRHHLLWSTEAIVSGAGWLYSKFNLYLRNITSISIFVLALLVLIKVVFPRQKLFLKYIFLFPFVFFTSEVILTPFIQWLVVRPRELYFESKYIERSIKATRKAFQIDSMKTRLINPNPKITSYDLKLGESTLKNIRLWDSQPLLATNSQLQQLRLYYRFSDAAVDRYKLRSDSNERQQVIIAARELDQTSLPRSSKTWLNKHFVFTHGYGFTVSPVNTKASDGLPEYFISDLGTSTRIQGNEFLKISENDVRKFIPIGNAAIYFGTFDSPYVVVPSKLQELDFPEGDKNVFNHYKGTGGLPLNTIFNNISAAFYLNEPRILNTGSVIKSSRLLLKRNVLKRIKHIAPFLKIMGEPYLISVNLSKSDNLDFKQNQYWIVEGYTSSRTYPYSAAIYKPDEIRYIRNSVKIIVDSYNGKVQLYISEPNDPIINGWFKIFPELFKPISKMPDSIKQHLKVPTEFFDIKVKQLLRYHVTDPKTFYNGDDLWQVPKELYGKDQVPVEPYHITAQLSPDLPSEFLLLQPLTPLARPNLSAWLAARNDSINYGQLVLLRFPSETTVFGPEQIQALINQDPNISQQFSLWDRAGSEVIQGNLLVLPLGKSLLYVEPVYLKASKGGLPTLARVVVSDGKKIVMAENLTDGLTQLLKK